MNFVVMADNERYESLKASGPDAKWKRIDNRDEFLTEPDANAFFNLMEDSHEVNYGNIKVPVFINSVNTSLSEINAGENIIRINAWHGFIEKDVWEVAGKITPSAESVLTDLGKKIIVVNDEPGFVTARVIAMIINEAFFAKGENISTPQDIDTAMKLGTNYPYGPFEWGKLIGLKNIYALLKKLSLSDVRYMPAPALAIEIGNCQ